MDARLSRRIALAGAAALLSSLFAPRALAQSDVTSALSEFRRGLIASTSFFGEFAMKIEIAAREDALSAEERAALNELLTAINGVLNANLGVISVLEVYAADARAGSAGPDDWDRVVAQARSTAEIVRDALAIAQSADELRIDMPEAQTSALERLLVARITILDRLQQLPPPSTEAELTEFDAVILQYRLLIEALMEVGGAIQSEAERLTPCRGVRRLWRRYCPPD